MLLKVKNPRTIFRVAMVCLAAFASLGIPALASRLNADVVDGLRGALLGATLVLVYLTFRLRRARENDRAR
jgi:hypothetical protein